MTHQLSWPVPGHVLTVTLVDTIMADEVQEIASALYQIIETESPSTIHLLIDAREAKIQDKLWNYAKLNLKRHKRCGHVIVIGDSRLSGLIIAIFSKLLNSHIHYSETSDAALKFLQERDAAVAEYLA
jgi:hypothetical protein